MLKRSAAFLWTHALKTLVMNKSIVNHNSEEFCHCDFETNKELYICQKRCINSQWIILQESEELGKKWKGHWKTLDSSTARRQQRWVHFYCMWAKTKLNWEIWFIIVFIEDCHSFVKTWWLKVGSYLFLRAIIYLFFKSKENSNLIPCQCSRSRPKLVLVIITKYCKVL